MIALLADGLIFVIALVGGIALLLWTPKPKLESYKVAAVAGLTSLLVGKLMSLLYQPEGGRPFEQSGGAAGAAYIDNPGFPSDHALFATVIVLAVYALTRKKWLSLALGLAVIVMCIGRVLAMVHTPLDVAGGILAGLIGGLWYAVSLPQARSKK